MRTNCSLIVVSLMMAGCAHNARDVLSRQLQVDFPKDVSLCSSGTMGDPVTCRPAGGGGAIWSWNDNVGLFGLDDGDKTTVDDLTAQVRKHYMGALYYKDDMHPSCRTQALIDAIPMEPTPADSLDIAATLKRVAVTKASADFEASAKAKNFNVSASMKAKFESNLSEQVDKAVQANIIWFTTRLTGGVETLSRIKGYSACYDEYMAVSKLLPGVITGVAGFIVRHNVMHTNITLGSVVDIAVDAAFAGESGPNASVLGELKGSLHASWENSVDQTVKIKVDREANKTVVYPLWVQFENAAFVQNRGRRGD